MPFPFVLHVLPSSSLARSWAEQPAALSLSRLEESDCFACAMAVKIAAGFLAHRGMSL